MCDIKKGFEVIDRAEDGISFIFKKGAIHFKHPVVNKGNGFVKINTFGDQKKFTVPDIAKTIPLNLKNDGTIEVNTNSRLVIKNRELAKALYELLKRGGVKFSLRPENDIKRKTQGRKMGSVIF